MEIRLFLIDDDQIPLVGMSNSTSLVIRRYSDGLLLDWGTMTFVASGGSEPNTNFEEENYLTLPGFYKKEVDVSGWDSGMYQTFSYFTSGGIYRSGMDEISIRGGIEVNTYQEYVASTSTPAASVLAQEYFTNQDIDGDGLIYGVDFYISTNRPKMLDNIPRIGVAKTWTQYQADHPEYF
jgi:hypothetical protein